MLARMQKRELEAGKEKAEGERENVVRNRRSLKLGLVFDATHLQIVTTEQRTKTTEQRVASVLILSST